MIGLMFGPVIWFSLLMMTLLVASYATAPADRERGVHAVLREERVTSRSTFVALAFTGAGCVGANHDDVTPAGAAVAAADRRGAPAGLVDGGMGG